MKWAVAICLFLALGVGPVAAADPQPQRPPNFVLILCDNLGYGDIGCFGSKLHLWWAVLGLSRQYKEA